MANRKIEDIFRAFKVVFKIYLQRGFRVTDINVDGEFAPIKPLRQGMPGGPKVNLASASEHIPEIERRIRVVKERCRAIRHSLPYNRIPRLLTIWIVFNSVR